MPPQLSVVRLTAEHRKGWAPPAPTLWPATGSVRQLQHRGRGGHGGGEAAWIAPLYVVLAYVAHLHAPGRVIVGDVGEHTALEKLDQYVVLGVGDLGARPVRLADR